MNVPVAGFDLSNVRPCSDNGSETKRQQGIGGAAGAGVNTNVIDGHRARNSAFMRVSGCRRLRYSPLSRQKTRFNKVHFG